MFKPTPSLLYHNNGDGTFTEVSAGTDIRRALGKGLGVVATDVNGDGRMDLFVANDTVQNFLFMNRGAGEVGGDRAGGGGRLQRQRHAALRAWAWTPPTSTATAARICSSPTSTRKCSRSTATTARKSFTDVAAANGISQATRLLSGWGLKFFDYDNDGAVDLILANGHPDDMIENYSQQVRYKEPLLLFHHDGTKLVNVSAQAGPAFTRSYPARGLAVGDYNNDGRVDVLIGNNGGAPVLLKNNAGDGNHWLGVKLQGTTCNRDAIGATITWSAGGKQRSRYKANGGSYLSSHDLREVARHRRRRETGLARDQVARRRAPGSSGSPTCRWIAT